MLAAGHLPSAEIDYLSGYHICICKIFTEYHLMRAEAKKFELSPSPSVQRPSSSEIGHVQLLQSTPGTILANKSPPEGQARDIWSLGEVRHRGMRFRQAHQVLSSNIHLHPRKQVSNPGHETKFRCTNDLAAMLKSESQIPVPHGASVALRADQRAKLRRA